ILLAVLPCVFAFRMPVASNTESISTAVEREHHTSQSIGCRICFELAQALTLEEWLLRTTNIEQEVTSVNQKMKQVLIVAGTAAAVGGTIYALKKRPQRYT